MANENRLAGTATLYINGANYLVAGNFTWSPSRKDRETMVGMDGVHGYSEKPTAGFIAADLRDTGGLVVGDFDDMTDVTVVAELANGKTVVGRNVWTVGQREVNSTEATVPVRWEGAVSEY